jgi:saccharopine dehydrogenase-like NADP-dependent oxidoreductase
MSQVHRIFIAGAGGIGRAAGLILAQYSDFEVEIYIGDLQQRVAEAAAQWITSGCSHPVKVHPVVMPEDGSNAAMDEALEAAEVLLDCLPGSQAPRMARFAVAFDLHYANLTEYVKESAEVMEIAQGSKRGFVLQTGLAPGFINVLAMHLYQSFTQEHQVTEVEKITMKVGALTKHAQAPHFYGFTWSPIGVATEYLKDCVVVRNGKTRTLPALSECQTIVIDGLTLEDNFTSGGAADLPQALEGKVKDLDYKTLRYPGHYSWVLKQIQSIPEDNRIAILEQIMLDNIPQVEEDMVVVFASVQGKDQYGNLRAIQKSYSIPPMVVGSKTLRAIQSTTAAPLCECARMLLENRWQGPVLQSMIEPLAFLNGKYVSRVYGSYLHTTPVPLATAH